MWKLNDSVSSILFVFWNTNLDLLFKAFFDLEFDTDGQRID